MSTSGKVFPVSRSEISKWGFILLISILTMSSFTDSGVFSSQNTQQTISVIIPLFLTSYLIIVAIIRFIGLNPNKFELVFIPLIILLMIYASLVFTDLMPNVKEKSTETKTDSTEGLDKESNLDPETSFTETGRNTNQNQLLPSNEDTFNNLISKILGIILIISAVVAVIFILIYLAKRGDAYIQGIEIAKEIKYTKPSGQYQLDIIEFYTEASFDIEYMMGKAPIWYSPTRFSDDVQIIPGPPLSSYFDRLTLLYEQARFSNKKIETEDVMEAKELRSQVKAWYESKNLESISEEN